jgi:iron complex transport system substrate-binding protein
LRIKNRILPVIAVAAAVLLGAACGTSDDATEGNATTPAASAVAAHAGTPAAPTAVAAATPELPVTVQDHAGRSVTVTDISRIIPLNGEVAEIVYALGLGENVWRWIPAPPSCRRAPPNVGYQRAQRRCALLGPARSSATSRPDHPP